MLCKGGRVVLCDRGGGHAAWPHLQAIWRDKHRGHASVGEAVSGEGSASPVALAMAGLATLTALTIVTIRRRRHASANAQGVEHVPLAESDEETEAETPKGSALSEEEREKLTASV